MIRFIILRNKPLGNQYYICDGSGCVGCVIRFKCFTNAAKEVVEIDWSQIKTKKSPMRLLRDVTSSRVYVKGSKRYKILADKI